jgi:hypothetical protein
VGNSRSRKETAIAHSKAEINGRNTASIAVLKQKNAAILDVINILLFREVHFISRERPDEREPIVRVIGCFRRSTILQAGYNCN